jgi:4-hydroxybenzoate polyprenyltransferase
MVKHFIALAKASHFIPTLVVTTLSFTLALKTSNLSTALGVALTIFSGQLIIGWSNDLIDYQDDIFHKRINKPLVAQQVSPKQLSYAITIVTIILFILTIFGPLSGRFGVIHLVAVVSALAYNAKLKTTVFSFIPWAISFGLLPIFVLGATRYPFKLWIVIIGALFGIGLHIANVFKDFEQDRQSGILNLPNIIGIKISKFVCALCFGGGALILFSTTNQLLALLISFASLIYLFPIPTKLAFPFSMGLATLVMFSFIISLG